MHMPKYKAGIPKSLVEAIIQEPSRFVAPLKGNLRVVDFGTFVSELQKQYSGNNCNYYLFQDLDKELLRVLFNSQPVRDLITRNIGKAEADRLYAQEVQQTLPSVLTAVPIGKRRVPQPSAPVMRKVRNYSRRGQAVKGYSRAVGMKWSPAQVKFLSVRKTAGMKPADILREYNQSFITQQRSYESVRKKCYRI